MQLGSLAYKHPCKFSSWSELSAMLNLLWKNEILCNVRPCVHVTMQESELAAKNPHNFSMQKSMLSSKHSSARVTMHPCVHATNRPYNHALMQPCAHATTHIRPCNNVTFERATMQQTVLASKYPHNFKSWSELSAMLNLLGRMKDYVTFVHASTLPCKKANLQPRIHTTFPCKKACYHQSIHPPV